MRLGRIGAALLALGLLPSCAGRLAMVGLDRHGNPTEAFVQERKYAEHLRDALLQAEESVLPALEARSAGGDWQLKAASLGFTVSASAGIGPFSVGIRPRVGMIFTRRNEVGEAIRCEP